MIFNYIEDLAEIIEFLLAIGSMMGMLGLVIGLIGCLLLGQSQRKRLIGLMIVSVILLMVCGVNTGIRYFRIY